MRSCRELIVWQKAMDLVVNIYRITRAFPKSEIYGLAGQMQRSSVSVLEHRRGSSSQTDSGVPEASRDRERFTGRAGNSTRDRETSWISAIYGPERV